MQKSGKEMMMVWTERVRETDDGGGLEGLNNFENYCKGSTQGP